jgi:type IV pilus assembly protein PilV
MMKRHKNFFAETGNNSRGFSLLEVLLGITVFMIGMLGVTALNISSLKSTTFAGNMSEAVIIAGDRLEKLMGINDFEHGDLTAGDHPDPDNPIGRNGMYTVSWNVVIDDPLPERTKTVNVTVEWDIKGTTRTMSMRTIILDHE